MTRLPNGRVVVAACVALCVASSISSAQAPSTFTARDMLGVTTTSVADLSEDGRWLLVTASLAW